MPRQTRRTEQIDVGYRLPETAECRDMICIRAYVPRDSHYLAAWWSQYDDLTKWLAWERESTKAGKVAADVWRDCFALARLDYELSRGCDYITPPQHDDDGQGELADYLWHWYDILTKAADFAADGKTIVQWRAYAADTYAVYYARLADPIFEAIEQMEYEDAIEQIDALDWGIYYSHWCEYKRECQDIPFNAIATCYISEIIDAIVDTLHDAGTTVALAFEDALSAIFSPGGMGNNGDWASTEKAANLGSNFNFGAIVCTWIKTWDFSVDDGGWYTFLGGEWIDGVGWGCSSEYISGYYRNIVSIKRDFGSSQVIRVSVVYDFDKGQGDAGTTTRYIGYGSKYEECYWDNQDEGMYLIASALGEATADEVRVDLQPARKSTPLSDLGSATIRSVTVEGLGDDPFL